MAKVNANTIDLGSGKTRGRAGKIIELNGLPTFTMPKTVLDRGDVDHWFGFRSMPDGSIRLSWIEKPLENLDARIADHLGLTLEQWSALPAIIQERERRNVPLEAAATPITFEPDSVVNADVQLVYDKPMLFTPAIETAERRIDKEMVERMIGVVNAVNRHHTATINAKINGAEAKNYLVNDHVPVDRILLALGALKLTPQYVPDPAHENEKRLSNFRVEAANRYSDSQALATAIRAVQVAEREKAAKAKQDETNAKIGSAMTATTTKATK